MNNIVIIGFPGAGKTTLGKKLSERLHLQFIDLDDAIETQYHATIPHIFEKYGEIVFRKCEYQTLCECLELDNVLIATGGGAPCSDEAMRLINKKSISVYIKLTEEQLVERLLNSKKKRPLTQNKTREELRDYVHQTLALREPYYLQAKEILNATTDSTSID